jgi:hypothetical protein
MVVSLSSSMSKQRSRGKRSIGIFRQPAVPHSHSVLWLEHMEHVLDLRPGPAHRSGCLRSAGDEEIGSPMFLPRIRDIVGIVNGRSLHCRSTPMPLR